MRELGGYTGQALPLISHWGQLVLSPHVGSAILLAQGKMEGSAP